MFNLDVWAARTGAEEGRDLVREIGVDSPTTLMKDCVVESPSQNVACVACIAPGNMVVTVAAPSVCCFGDIDGPYTTPVLLLVEKGCKIQGSDGAIDRRSGSGGMCLTLYLTEKSEETKAGSEQVLLHLWKNSAKLGARRGEIT